MRLTRWTHGRIELPIALALVALCAPWGCLERGSSKSHGEEKPAASDPGPASSAGDVAARGPRLATSPAGRPQPDATIAVALEAEPAHLNPLLAGDAVANRIALGDIYEGLLCQSDPLAPAQPCLASSVETDEAGTVWRFQLREGVSWHDGRPFDAGDVLFTYGLITGPGALPTWLAADFDDLEAIERTERGVIMRFAGHRLGRREAFARVPIVPRHVFEKTLKPARARLSAMLAHRGTRHPVGTGPLRFALWRPGDEIALERFDGYWGQPAGAKRVIYRLIASRPAAVRALAAGRLDIAVQLPVDEAIRAVENHEGLALFHYQRPSYLAAVYNVRRAPLAAAETRRALGMLIDRASIARKLFAGHARAIAGPYLDSDPDRDRSLAPLPFDPKAAGALLGGAGRSPKISLELLVPAGSRTMQRIADIWTDDARDAIALSVARQPYAQVLDRLRRGDFDIALMAFTTGLDLDLYIRFHSGQEQNFGSLTDPELDRALEAVRAEPDPDRRRVWQHRAQRRLHQLQPYTFIASDTRVGVARSGVGGFARAAFGARGLWRER